MADSEQQLREAFALMKEGKTNEAGRIVQNVIREDANNVRAWWMMANLVDDPARKQKAAERVLALDPTHQGAVKMMTELDPSYTPPRRSQQQRSQANTAEPTRGGIDNLDFSKLGATDPALATEGEETRSDLRVATLAMSAIGILIIVAIGIAIFFQVQEDGFSLFGLGGSPEKAVQDYFTALSDLDFDRMANLSCAADQDDLRAAQSEFDGDLIPGADLGELTIDTSGLTTTITERTDNRAVVQIGGEITLAVEDFSLSLDVDELSEGTLGSSGVVIRENGKWVVCTE